MQQYSPVLGNKLQFPETWKGAIIFIGSDGFDFYGCETERQALTITDGLLNGKKGRVWLFFHFHEMIHATQHQEKENRQFCMMVDMVSWYCQGPETIRGLNPAPELPF
jgi:hypothetical protein